MVGDLPILLVMVQDIGSPSPEGLQMWALYGFITQNY
jgi:hypothetical protein